MKRRIDLDTPVTNKNGRIEEAGELDDDDGRIEEGGEVDFDLVKDSVKSNDGSLFRRNVTPVRAINKSAAVWKHFKVYPNSPITDPTAYVSEWHKYAVCTHCYDKHNKNESVKTSTLWEVNYGRSHSTSKLVGHLQRNHIGLYKDDGKAAVEHAANIMYSGSSVGGLPPPPPHPNLPSGITLNSANPSVASKQFWQSSMNDHLCNKRQLMYRLMKWIVNGFNNLDEIEDEDFRKLLEAVNPNVPVISTPHLVDQLYDQYQIIHYFVKRYISKRLFTVTTDTWTASFRLQEILSRRRGTD